METHLVENANEHQPSHTSGADTAESTATQKVQAATDSTTESATEPTITVHDRRFWARQSHEKSEAFKEKKPTYVAELEQKLADKETRLQATLQQYKEALDDFEGAKARMRRDIQKEITAGKRAILNELLEVLDNLERTVQAAQTADLNTLLQGTRMVRDDFVKKLEQLGVHRVIALGQTFDPQRFEAVSMIPVQQAVQDGQVLGVVRDCYLLGEEVLRYGMVAVGQYTSAVQNNPATNQTFEDP